MIRKNKFNAQKTVIDDIPFSSKKEAKRYTELKILQRTGDVLWFQRQCPFQLPGNTKYFLDFQVYWKDGTITYEDVKGFLTPMFKLKLKQVETLYPIKITVI